MSTLQISTNAPHNLVGKTALITGSSSGIGAAIARELSSRGAKIVLNYPFESHKQACEDVGNSLQTEWISVQADLSTEKGPKDLVAATVARFGQIDILVNNAARFPNAKPWDVEAKAFDESFALNVRGPLLVTKAALPHLTPFSPEKEQPFIGSPGGARIICITSGTCRAPQSGGILYGATKGALESMVRNWARELPPKYGCTVNAVAPGPIWSKLMASLLTPEIVRDGYGELTPAVGCIGEVEDIARAVAFVADPESKWTNGVCLQVNGGMIMT
ncbi:hypothetical protein ACHAPJ_009751 [Fusarium lateritium]